MEKRGVIAKGWTPPESTEKEAKASQSRQDDDSDLTEHITRRIQDRAQTAMNKKPQQ